MRLSLRLLVKLTPRCYITKFFAASVWCQRIGAIPQFLSSLCSGNLVSIKMTLCAIRSMSIEFHRSLQQTKIVSCFFESYRNELLTILSLLYQAHDLYAMEGISMFLPFLLSHPSFKLCHEGTVAVYNLLRDLAIEALVERLSLE
jgi:hypothetical protein